MPRKGPKKQTSRDVRDEDRKLEKRRSKTAEQLEKNETEALTAYNNQCNPMMPASRGARRALRRALEKKDMPLERWTSRDALSPGFTVMTPSEQQRSDARGTHRVADIYSPTDIHE